MDSLTVSMTLINRFKRRLLPCSSCQPTLLHIHRREVSAVLRRQDHQVVRSTWAEQCLQRRAGVYLTLTVDRKVTMASVRIASRHFKTAMSRWRTVPEVSQPILHLLLEITRRKCLTIRSLPRQMSLLFNKWLQQAPANNLERQHKISTLDRKRPVLQLRRMPTCKAMKSLREMVHNKWHPAHWMLKLLEYSKPPWRDSIKCLRHLNLNAVQSLVRRIRLALTTLFKTSILS